jgi:ABC-type Zn uptake system ZnuABC Zn-binding protein ZnuA
MNDIKIYVVNQDNFEQFIAEFKAKNGGEARIVYYEQAVTPLPEDNKSE